MKIILRPLVLVLSMLCVIPANADLPLNIEGLFTEHRQLKLDFTLTYANSSRQEVYSRNPVVVQVGPGQFVSIPSQFGEAHSNSDSLIGGIGLRYGISSSIESYVRANWMSQQIRAQAVNRTESIRQAGLLDAWAGFNYAFGSTSSGGALLFFEVALAERLEEETYHGQSFVVGSTVYRTLDPVVLSITPAYRVNRAIKVGNEIQSRGDLFTINPQVSFAVNDNVTLGSGVTWRNEGAGASGGSSHLRKTATSLNLGMAYLWDQDTILNFTSRSNTSGGSGTELNMTLQVKLGGL